MGSERIARTAVDQDPGSGIELRGVLGGGCVRGRRLRKSEQGRQQPGETTPAQRSFTRSPEWIACGSSFGLSCTSTSTSIPVFWAIWERQQSPGLTT